MTTRIYTTQFLINNYTNIFTNLSNKIKLTFTMNNWISSNENTTICYTPNDIILKTNVINVMILHTIVTLPQRVPYSLACQAVTELYSCLALSTFNSV